jgi:lipid A ethanolaminephosphotransferase
MLRFSLKTISSTTLTILLAVYFAAALNLTLTRKLFQILSDLEPQSVLFYASIPLFFICVFTILFNFFTIKYVTKPFFMILIIASAAVNYGAYYFGVIFNTDMMTNIFETTSSEASSYANPKLFIMLFLTAIVPCAYLAWVNIIYRPLRYEIMAKAIVLVIAAVIIALIGALYYKDFASISRNNQKIVKDIVPTYFIGSTYKYVKKRYFTTPLPYTPIGVDATREPEKEKYLTVFLVGETARTQNYQWNGYNRPTNAYTIDIPNVFAFQDVASCGTATAVSLPCMFSFLGQDAYSREKFDAQDNVVDVLKRAGIAVTWVDNNTGCKGICENVESFGADEYVPVDCEGEDCMDDIFINILDKKIRNLGGKDGIIFMHLIGSHGPTYYKRYPRDHAKFLPDCQTSDLQQCTDEQITNSYDNTILYTDYVMAELIKRLQQESDTYHTSLVYVSDHGESLGENGIYLHGMPYSIAPIEQRRVPFMVWLSDKMIAHKKIDTACLQKSLTNGGYSHDNIAPTILNLMDVDTNAYHPEKDLLRACSEES